MTKEELMEKAKPILFNTEMVNAVLEGSKNETRRLVKFKDGKNPNWTGYIKDGLCLYNGRNELCNCSPPYKAGDILYIRETWCWCPCWDCGLDSQDGCCDETANRFYNNEKREYGCYGYKASFADNEEPFDTWKPSIHMPKAAARIFLKVKYVRMERLQYMDDEAAKKEGLTGCRKEKCENYRWCIEVKDCGRGCFPFLWNSTIKKMDLDKYGWDANPWVWVIGFERIQLN